MTPIELQQFYRDQYLGYLGEEIPSARSRGTRPRARNIGTWSNFQPRIKNEELNLSLAIINAINGHSTQVWVWSDQHFGHNNILTYSNRPFPNLDLMHECMVLNHNDYVAPDDISIWVGDVAFLKDDDANEILDQCNGYKILIVGNHDIYKKKVKNLNFDETHILKYVNVRYGVRDLQFLFTHYPLHNFKIKDKTFNIHGHEHVNHMYTNTPRHVNVNCELHGYKPINFTSIAEMVSKRQL